MKLKKMVLIVMSLISSVFAQDKPYSGAELYSNNTFMYGRYEARMYMAAGNGLVSSMFLYYNDSWIGKGEPWVEIDIEVLGKSPNTFQSNIISGTAESQITSEKHHNLSQPANTTYHTFAMEWTPNYVAWFVDDVEVRRAAVGSTDEKNQVPNLSKEQSLRFNLWSSTDPGWVGVWDENILPVHQFINWVKVYSYTPGQGPNGSDFTLSWVDNFDTLDESRWGKGDWTFDKNRVTMNKNNINVKDNTLILSITKVGQEGFTGTVPVDPGENTSIETPKRNLEKRPSDIYEVKTFDLKGRYQGLQKIER
jgi:beta-glucanase (GH16 family)